MFNKNSFKTAMLFLGIIFLVIIIRMFAGGDILFVKDSNIDQVASSPCILENEIC